MAIERQVPDPAQTAEPVQDLTTERSADDLDEQIIEVLEGLDEEGIQVQDDGSVILGEPEVEMPGLGFGENLAVLINNNNKPLGTRILYPISEELRANNLARVIAIAPTIL